MSFSILALKIMLFSPFIIFTMNVCLSVPLRLYSFDGGPSLVISGGAPAVVSSSFGVSSFGVSTFGVYSLDSIFLYKIIRYFLI